MRFTAILFLVQLILHLPVGAQDLSTLRVLVISEQDGTPVVGATILLTEPDADSLYVGVTNADGFHEFSNVTPMRYRIHISYIGFETHRELLTLEPGATRVYRPELKRGSEELGELTVRARGGAVRREAGRQTITAELISRVPSPGPGGDLVSYLQTQPGVVSGGDRGGELFIRGGTPPQNLFLVDNLPVIKPFHISNLFSAFPQELISRVDFYAGGFGAEYTGATSAVMDVNLRQGNMRRFETRAAVSPYMLSFLAEGPVKPDEQSLLVMGRTSIIEKTGPSLTGTDVPLEFYDLTARYSINWPGLTCSITGLFTSDSGRINPQRNLRLSWSNTTIGSRCLGFAEDLEQTIDLNFGYTGYSSSETGFNDTVRESNIRMVYLGLNNDWNILDQSIKYGARLDIIQFEALLEDPFAERFGGGTRFSMLDSSLDRIISTINAYAAGDWQISPSVKISPGIATQILLSRIQPTIEPRFRASWNPGNSNRREFNLALGRYMQVREAISDERDAGTVFYVYKPIEADDPLPESLHGIVGYRQQIGNHVDMSLENYYKIHKNVPVAQWTREPGNTLNTALAEGNTYGVDLQLEYDRGPLYLALGYGLSEITYRADANELRAWLDGGTFQYNPTHDRRHQLSLVSSYRFAGFNAALSWFYSSGNPYTKLFAIDMLLDVSRETVFDRGRIVSLYSEPFDARFPSFQRLDVSLSRLFNLSPGVSIETEIGAINAYNVQNIFYFDVNTLQQVDQLPFMPYFSLSTRFQSSR